MHRKPEQGRNGGATASGSITERKGDEGPGGNLNPFMDIATPYISRLRACIVNVVAGKGDLQAGDEPSRSTRLDHRGKKLLVSPLVLLLLLQLSPLDLLLVISVSLGVPRRWRSP